MIVLYRVRHGRLILGLLAGIILGSRPIQAQYTANYQTNVISGVTSNWSGDYLVGSNTFADVLVIQNSSVLSDGFGYVGYEVSSSNNCVLVSGSNSVWTNSLGLGVGYLGMGNSLVISNGGLVISGDGYVGWYSDGNNVLVTGTGSVWSNGAGLLIGYSGANNSLVISNGGHVVSDSAVVGPGGSGRSRAWVVGIGSVWENANDLVVGESGGDQGNSLVISDGGHVVDAYGRVGSDSGANNVLVSGSGSVWSNLFDLKVGMGGVDGNSLVISNGGEVVCAGSVLGSDQAGNVSVLVTGSNSIWSNSGDLVISYSEATGNSLVIDNGSQVINNDGYVGYDPSSANNSVRVAGGAVWRNQALHIGYNGSANSLIVAGGSVLATNLTVGIASDSCDNWVQLDSGSLIVSNATGDAVIEVCNGMLTQNGGVLQADRLVVTNACSLFIRNGGTLNVGSIVLDPNQSAVGDGIPNWWKQQYGFDPFDPTVASADPDGDEFTNLQEYLAGTDPTNAASYFHITTVARETNNNVRVTWMMGSGKTNALQVTTGDASGSYNTNSFTSIFTVVNTVGTVTNYLDVGGATNRPARYYRVRLVP